MYSMFQPIISKIYNAKEGFVFEGVDGRRWRDPINLAEDKDASVESVLGELLYKFEEPIKVYNRTYTHYASQTYTISTGIIGNQMILEIKTSKNEYSFKPVFSFHKLILGDKFKPTPYQTWDKNFPGEKECITLSINDSVDLTFPEWIFWDGDIMESDPAQISVSYPVDRKDEFNAYIYEKKIL